jgi:dynein heavy chain
MFSVLAQILEEYKERHSGLHLVLFDDALEHLTRVHRVLRMHKGHVMIIGVGGVGKQSLLRLAAFAAGAELVMCLSALFVHHCSLTINTD